MGRALNKLLRSKDEHINLPPQLRMRVKLAAQVLSSSMANAILARSRPKMSRTAEFCRTMDRWFDCFKGTCINEGEHKRKSELAPYYSP